MFQYPEEDERSQKLGPLGERRGARRVRAHGLASVHRQPAAANSRRRRGELTALVRLLAITSCRVTAIWFRKVWDMTRHIYV